MKIFRQIRAMFGKPDDLKRPTFDECPELAAKIRAARGVLPENSVKAVHSWPVDANGSPIDYEDIPVG